MLVVIQRSEAFRDVWTSLASELGVSLVQVDAGAELPSATEATAVLLVVAGEEARVVVALEGLPYPPRSVAVVGADDDRRVAIAAIRAGAGEYFALPADMSMLRAWIEEKAADRARDERSRALVREESARYDFSKMIGASAGLRAALERAARGSRAERDRPDRGRDRHRQGAGRAAPSTTRPARREAVRRRQLRARSRETCSRASCSATRRARSPARSRARRALRGRRRRHACSSTRSASCRSSCRRSSCACSRSARSRRVGARRTDRRSTCASSRRRTATCAPRSSAAAFREDLYYRLHVVPHRACRRCASAREDIPLLAEHFLERFAAEHRLRRRRSPDDARRAARHAWPGNVRELRNVVERAVLLGEGALDRE